MEAPAWWISDVTKPFILYISKRKGIMVRVLTQKLGMEPYLLAYFSKRLDGTASGWFG
jgi:hypothetical protein